MDSSYLKKLIPKDKFDIEPIPTLMKISEDEVKPILPELLFCVADMNWPIAAEMVKVLARFPNSIIPLIKEILKPTETDEEWKYFIITDLIPKLPQNSQMLLSNDIARIIDCPTDEEKCSVWRVAKKYREELGGKYESTEDDFSELDIQFDASKIAKELYDKAKAIGVMYQKSEKSPHSSD